MLRNRVVYIPFRTRGNKVNEYSINMVQILSKKYQTVGKLAEPVDIVQMLHTKAVFLNWVEEQIDTKMKIQLLLYKLLGAKVVWTFHNRQPHDTENTKLVQKNMLWLANNSTNILLHSKCSKRYVPNLKRNGKKAVFVPHILYKERNNQNYVEQVRNDYGIQQADFVFTIFGSISPYKNIEGGIDAFKGLGREHVKLLIAGRSYSKDYAKKIKNLCKENENIILDLHFISNERLGAIISVSDVIVMPYKNCSSMNSGVMIQAFSQGRTVIAPDICMARDMDREGFFYMYHDGLKQVMERAYRNGRSMNRIMGVKAKKYVIQNNNEQLVGRSIERILN